MLICRRNMTVRARARAFSGSNASISSPPPQENEGTCLGGNPAPKMLDENPTPAAYVEAVKTLRAMQDEATAQTVLAMARRRWPDHEQLKQL